jgi:hypothetical protein
MERKEIIKQISEDRRIEIALIDKRLNELKAKQGMSKCEKLEFLNLMAKKWGHPTKEIVLDVI